MPRLTPFHPRTSALNESFLWKEWSGYAAVRRYDGHSEREYYAVRHAAGLLDATPLNKYDVTGPDAGKLLGRVFTRDISRLARGRVTYSAMCDERGECLDDGTVARIGEQHYRVSTSERWLRWLQRHGRRMDVQVVDTTDRLCTLALQGPNSRAILEPLVEWDMNVMRFFRIRKTTLAGLPVWVSRTGYTGDLGYEIWMENQHALAVWDAIIAEGKRWGLEPIGLDALDVVRIEAGFVLQGIDYVSARRCLIEERKSTPEEAGLGWTVDLERKEDSLAPTFIGQRALRAERRVGAEWGLVGLELDWEATEKLYEEYGLPPHLAPEACRDPVPIYDPNGTRQVGQVTSTTWSPLLKRYIAIGQVYAPFAAKGTGLRVEHTVEFRRRQLPATVVDMPFFDPPRKKHTPKTPQPTRKAS